MAFSNLLIFPTLFLLFSPLFASSDLLHKECTHAPKIVPSLNPDRCLALLSTDPKAANATNIKQLAIIGLQLAVANSSEVLEKIRSDADNSKIPEVKSALNATAFEVGNANGSFKSALAEVKEDDDFQTANYDCFVVSDYTKNALEELKKVEGKVDPSHAVRIGTLTDFGYVNYVLTYDADV